MNADPLKQLLAQPDFRFNVWRCHAEQVTLLTAKFLRWVYLEGSVSNQQVMQTFGIGLAYAAGQAGYVVNPLGERDGAHTNLWSLTEDGLALLKRLTA